MSASNGTTFKGARGFFRVLPFLALGGIVFAFNSANDWNYFVKGYITLLELQAAIVVIYFLSARIGRSKNRLLK